MCFEEIDESLQPYVHGYYKHQLVYLLTATRVDQEMRRQHHDRFNEARSHLASAGCSFKKKDPPEEGSDHLTNVFERGLYQMQLQEFVFLRDDILLPLGNLEDDIRRICDKIK
jgi:hypothetical protein